VEEVRILGVRVDCVDMQAALARIEKLVDAGGHHMVATVNPEFVMSAQQNAEFAQVLEAADLCLADGTGVVWAARRSGCTLSVPVTGVDLVPHLAELCERRGFKLFLLGAATGVADELASSLRTRHPRLDVAAHPGSPEPESDESTLRLITAHRTQVLLVAYGAPRQELWIDRVKGRLGDGVAIGVGGAFDYLTGRESRAPGWMRRAGLEWLYRLVRQPWRIRRMVALPVYAIKVVSAGR
jgi:N-acetylglucosaminyldiphosphoundecaprenol N-acetyl-beta-D-mannosaminyltransferase